MIFKFEYVDCSEGEGDRGSTNGCFLLVFAFAQQHRIAWYISLSSRLIAIHCIIAKQARMISLSTCDLAAVSDAPIRRKDTACEPGPEIAVKDVPCSMSSIDNCIVGPGRFTNDLYVLLSSSAAGDPLGTSSIFHISFACLDRQTTPGRRNSHTADKALPLLRVYTILTTIATQS